MRRSLLGLIPVAGALAACGGSAAAVNAPPRTPSAHFSAASAPPTGTATPAPPVGSASPTPAFSHGILAAQTSAQVAPDGSAVDPRDTFVAATDRRIFVVLTLDPSLPPGTTLAFLRTLDGAFVDSRQATLARRARSFYVEFTALPQKSFTPGLYRVRLYVDGKASGEVDYRVV